MIKPEVSVLKIGYLSLKIQFYLNLIEFLFMKHFYLTA